MYRIKVLEELTRRLLRLINSCYIVNERSVELAVALFS